MKFIGDFHIHSKYARATSQDMVPENLDVWAKKKGIKVLGTGDFTHPAWFADLKSKLSEQEPGLYALRGSDSGTRFVFSSEISCIYSKKGRVRRIHLLLLVPSLQAAASINNRLDSRGNLRSDGRPILGIDATEVLKIALDASAESLVIPAHAWTPWFSVFGSKSGFDSLEECFDEYAKHIHAIETGLSSDPPMNWRLSALDKIALISNSDCHSLAKMGREANVFDTEFSYQGIRDAIVTKDPGKFLSTVEFFPEEGKYHYDGHRLCQVCLSPAESRSRNNICPKCGRELTIGVLNRVEELADRPPFDKSTGGKPEGAIPFKSLIPLQEIIAEALHMGVVAKQCRAEYEKLISAFGNEFAVLLEVEPRELRAATLPAIAQAIAQVRAGQVIIEPGYDGEYGKIQIFGKQEEMPTVQKQLF
ncbi:MAG: DNA helicase UvrD [Parcubacteria group bacterium]|nr:DNA helicase UvrD [Parcubacteria group bacterium]